MISVFYGVSAGSISDQAREHFFNSLASPYGPNVRLVDGTGLTALDRWASFNRGALVREQLTGLIAEIIANREVLSELAVEVPKCVNENGPYPIIRCRLEAVAAFLEHPVLATPMSLNKMQRYWQIARAINDVTDSIGAPLSAGDYKRHRMEGIAQLSPQANALGLELEQAARSILAQLGPSLPL